MIENPEQVGPEHKDLYEHHKFTAAEGQEPLRVDKYLMNFIENATRNKIQQAAKDGNIFVNDKAVKSNFKVKGNDVVKVLFAHPPHENLLVGEDIPLDIIYEDDDSDVEEEIRVVIDESTAIEALPELNMVELRDIKKWFAKYRTLAASSRERKALIEKHFGTEKTL